MAGQCLFVLVNHEQIAMRPSTSVPESSQYECPSCGARTSDPDDRVCPGCGTSMRSLDNGRDL